MRSAVAALLVTMSAAAFQAAAADGTTEEPPKPPNILLVTLDTTRADHLPCYGHDAPTMPFLCGLAASNGLIFDNAFTPSPLTLPAHASLLTGLEVQDHRVYDNGIFRLDPEIETIAERLQANGYSTHAYLSSLVLDRIYGLDQGFDTYDDSVRVGRQEQFRFRERAASQVVDVVLEDSPSWFEPWFVWVHFYDPHDPYVPPRRHASRFRHPYDGELAFVDEQLQRLFSHLEDQEQWQSSRDWAFIAGDHGEDLGDHGEMRHGILLTPATLRIPLIVVAPMIEAKRISTTVSLIDVAATIARIGSPKRTIREIGNGVNLLDSSPTPRMLNAVTLMPYYSFRWSPIIGIFDAPFLMLMGRHEYLYQIDADPGLQRSLVESRPEIFTSLRESMESLKANVLSTLDAVSLDPEEQRRLQSLGYVSVARDAPEGELFSLPDPHEKVHVYRRFLECKELIGMGAHKRAKEDLEGLLEEDENNTLVLNTLASIYEREGQYEKAEELLQKTSSILPKHDYTHLQLAEFYMRTRQLEKAERKLDEVLFINDRNAEGYLKKFELEMQRGRMESAFGVLEAARAHGVRDGMLFVYLAIGARNRGAWEEARGFADEAATLTPDDPAVVLEGGKIRCAGQSPFRSECRSWLEGVPAGIKSGGDVWGIAAEWLEGEGRRAESLYCWQQALDRRSGHPRLPQRARAAAERLRSEGVAPQVPDWF